MKEKKFLIKRIKPISNLPRILGMKLDLMKSQTWDGLSQPTKNFQHMNSTKDNNQGSLNSDTQLLKFNN